MPNDLNLADWIDRRRADVGPYADHIIKSVRSHEAEIERLRGFIARRYPGFDVDEAIAIHDVKTNTD